MDYACTSPANQDRAKQLEDSLGRLSALAHASMAGVAMAAAEFDEIHGWCDGYTQSFPHWLAVTAGFHPNTGKDLLRVGKALKVFAADSRGVCRRSALLRQAAPDNNRCHSAN